MKEESIRSDEERCDDKSLHLLASYKQNVFLLCLGFLPFFDGIYINIKYRKRTTNFSSRPSISIYIFKRTVPSDSCIA